MPLKHLSNFCRPLEMPLINCKVELKLKWRKYFVLSAVGHDNDNKKDDKIIFTIKDTELYVPVKTLSARNNQKLSKLFSKGSERSVYWNEYTTKSENKNKTNEPRFVSIFRKFDFKKFVLVNNVLREYNEMKEKNK